MSTSTTIIVQQPDAVSAIKQRHRLNHSVSLIDGSTGFLSPSTNGRLPPSISPQMRRAHPQPSLTSSAPAPSRVFKFDNFSDQPSGRIVDLGISDDELVFFSKTYEKV